MAKRRIAEDYSEPCPTSLDGHPFYGMTLDPEQKVFAEAILDPQKLVIFANSCAGTGKTTVAMGAANLLVKHGLYDGIIGLVSACNEGRQGFLPGDITAKSEVYFEPFYQAMIECKMNPQRDVCDASMVNQKTGEGIVKLLTESFIRGTNFHNKVVIIDECQNFTGPNLKKAITRISDSCKLICIGHDGQCDLENRAASGFVRYIRHFEGDNRVAICTLTTNHRGWISSRADELEF